MPDAEVRFLSGGTQTNKVVISTMLKPWQGVIAARTGHIAVHEAGAIEASGHKVIEIAEQQGKISAEAVDKVFRAWHGDGNRLHMVEPGMVYITQPTEYGTVYSLAELTALSEVCRRWGAPLYVDGARLFYALGSASNDVTLKGPGSSHRRFLYRRDQVRSALRRGSCVPSRRARCRGSSR